MGTQSCLGSSGISRVRIVRPLLGVALLVVLIAWLMNTPPAAAQSTATTTISGHVYDPRTTTDALPLPNVLVYASTTSVSAPSSGVQCLQVQPPTGAVDFTYTAFDGSFTLHNIPENATYTLVIQAGKWQRQFWPVNVYSDPLIGLGLHMPANHNQGNIPMIAIATGNVDGVECVLLHMGIDQSEFSDDSADPGPDFTSHIHLYKGSGGTYLSTAASGGAIINSSTPSESALVDNSNTLDDYDMVMFPCQGAAIPKSSLEMDHIVDFANQGGRIFTTHFSYDWLYPDPPYDSKFLPVANWSSLSSNQQLSEKQIPSGTGTIETDFTDGARMAQWLQRNNATSAGSSDQIEINTLRTDVSSVIAPTQTWLTYDDAADGNPVMQMTFNTPVGAPASGQCGRVMYNDYHVISISGGNGKTFPNECPSEAGMSPQEDMLEYALFDLSTFIKPVVAPIITWAAPAPIIYGTPLRSAQLSASASYAGTAVAGTFSYTPAAGAVLSGGQQKLSARFIPDDTIDYSIATASVTLTVLQATPTVTLTGSTNPAFLANATSFTATISSASSAAAAPGGTVTFYDGATQIGTATASGGTATLTLSSLAEGGHTITATYSGDTNYKPATSNALPETVEDFTLTATNGGVATVPPGGKAVFTLVVTPVGGATVPAAISLNVSGVPVVASAALTPSTIAANSASTDITLNVQMAGYQAAHRQREPFGRGTLPVSLGLILLPLTAFRRMSRRFATLVLMAVLGATVFAGLNGCGGNLGPQTFSFPVTATSGPLTHSLTVKITVAPQAK